MVRMKIKVYLDGIIDVIAFIPFRNYRLIYRVGASPIY